MDSTDSLRPSMNSDDRFISTRQPPKPPTKSKKPWVIILLVILVILAAVIIPVSVHLVNSNKASTANNQSSSQSSSQPTSVPGNAGNTTVSTNTTTPAQANPNVPPLGQDFGYGTRPIRGVNIGGWLVTEPFITPSLYSSYPPSLGIVDEWTLTAHLGAKAAQVLEQHYKTFVTEDTFKKIASLGLDHVRIGWPYWALGNVPGDPYIANISWSYLVQGVQWAKKYGLRVNLDYHAAPGSQNGWNHSGRQGKPGWLNGTASGTAFGQRAIQDHAYVAKFFSTPEYKDVVTIYGLVNEPNMIVLESDIVVEWSKQAYKAIRTAGFNGIIVVGDGFWGADNWHGVMTPSQGFPNMALDIHDYVIFNADQIAQTHNIKLQTSCNGWGPQIQRSMNTATGFGPTFVGEWSIADTDCGTFLNSVDRGPRWTGKFDTPTPACPGRVNCECNTPTDPSLWNQAYKTFLLANAELQMNAYQNGWGWFYWNFDTENLTQWSYFKSVDQGVIPQSPYNLTYTCANVPDMTTLGLPENY